MENRIEILRRHIDNVILDMADTTERRCAYLHLYGVSQACALIALRRGENVELATYEKRNRIIVGKQCISIDF